MRGYIFFAALMTVAFLTIGPGTAFAQTIGYAQAIDQLAVACGKDIRTHCRGVNLGNGRIADCLKRSSAKVSGRCKQTAARVWALLEKRAEAQASAARICQADAAELCQGVEPGDANILNCLLKASRAVSAACNRVITDAGWR